MNKKLFSPVFTLLTLALAVVSAGCGTNQVTSTSITLSATPNGSALGGMGQSELSGANATRTAMIVCGPLHSASDSDALDLRKVGDPCALLTESEVEAILGPVEYRTDTALSFEFRLGCINVLPTNGKTSLRIAVETLDTWETIPILHQGVEEVTGIGDAALSSNANNERALWVLLRDRAVVGVFLSPDSLQQAKELAAKIIEKLPR